MRNVSTKSLRKAAKPSTKNPIQTISMKVTAQEPAALTKTEVNEVSFCDSLPSSQDTVVSQELNKADLDDSAAYVTASEGRYCVSKASLQSSGVGCNSV